MDAARRIHETLGIASGSIALARELQQLTFMRKARIINGVYFGEFFMARAKSRAPQKKAPNLDEATDAAPTFRERLELILFIAVEVLCLLLFLDFLFFGFYVK